MTLNIQILQDAPDTVDHAPLLDFMQWKREWDNRDWFANLHYNMDGAGAAIVDFGMLHQELDDHFENIMGNPDDDTRPEVPDIRKWLMSEIKTGRALAWVSW